MLAYALYVAFVSAFVVIAAAGHVLLLRAIYPGIFGKPPADPAANQAVLENNPSPRSPKLAA